VALEHSQSFGSYCNGSVAGCNCTLDFLPLKGETLWLVQVGATPQVIKACFRNLRTLEQTPAAAAAAVGLTAECHR
jgi:hypothetical protein